MKLICGLSNSLILKIVYYHTLHKTPFSRNRLHLVLILIPRVLQLNTYAAMTGGNRIQRG
jgi:hypothetical protein